MLVSISYDMGATVAATCDLLECSPDADHYDPESAHALEALLRELNRVGHYWVGGGAAPLILLMRVQG